MIIFWQNAPNPLPPSDLIPELSGYLWESTWFTIQMRWLTFCLLRKQWMWGINSIISSCRSLKGTTTDNLWPPVEVVAEVRGVLFFTVLSLGLGGIEVLWISGTVLLLLPCAVCVNTLTSWQWHTLGAHDVLSRSTMSRLSWLTRNRMLKIINTPSITNTGLRHSLLLMLSHSHYSRYGVDSG